MEVKVLGIERLLKENARSGYHIKGIKTGDVLYIAAATGSGALDHNEMLGEIASLEKGLSQEGERRECTKITFTRKDVASNFMVGIDFYSSKKDRYLNSNEITRVSDALRKWIDENVSMRDNDLFEEVIVQ